MSIAYFPKLYPDELLCSAVARYRVHTMATANAQIGRELYNRGCRSTSVALPHNLNLIHQKIGPFIGMSVLDLAYRSTLFPYYAAFQRKKDREHLLSAMLQDQSRAVINSGWNPSVKRLKICTDCMQEDLALYGEAYWHRTHQLDCVHYCEIHVTPLLEAMVPHGTGRTLEALTIATPTKSYLPHIAEHSRQRLFEMGRLASFYLKNTSFSKKNIPSTAIPRGFREVYALTGNKLDMTRIRQDFVGYFGEQCLELLEIPVTCENTQNWLNLTFMRETTIPIKRIAFEIFSTNCVAQRAKSVRSQGYIRNAVTNRLWRCPNPAADHFGQKVISDVRLSNNFKTNDSINFRCSCGFVFHVKSSTWDRRFDPVPKRIHEYGDQFVELVRTLHKDGESISAISRRIKVDHDTIKRMLNPEYRTRNRKPSPELIEAISIAGRLGKARRTAFAISRPEYEMRDKELAQRIYETASQLLNQVPPIQVSTKRLLDISQISIETLVDEPYYPRALSALKDAYEPAPDFYLRRRDHNRTTSNSTTSSSPR